MERKKQSFLHSNEIQMAILTLCLLFVTILIFFLNVFADFRRFSFIFECFCWFLITFIWFFIIPGGSPWEYVPIYNSIHHYLHPNGSLSIMSSTQAQSGAYICQSTNGYGADIGKLIQVRVQEPPRFAVQSQSQSAQKDVPVKLICQPDGDRPIRMEWTLLNGTLLSEFMLARSHLKSDDGDDSLPFEWVFKSLPSSSSYP